MQEKFNRNYKLIVETVTPIPFITAGTRSVEIALPFTMEFDIKRSLSGAANSSVIRIYNLKPETRNQILKTFYDIGNYKKVTLRAWYGETLNFPMVFTGNVSQAFSVRQGNNFITQIQAYDGGFAYVNSRLNLSVPKTGATSNRSIIESAVDSLSAYGVSRGAIGNYPGNVEKGYVACGNTTEILSNELTGNGFFIDNGRANCLREDEYIYDSVTPTINSNSGLLGTPVREQGWVIVETLFEPQAYVGQRVFLESTTEKNYNGAYKVVSIHHKGIISEAVCGSATTTFQLLGNKSLIAVRPG